MAQRSELTLEVPLFQSLCRLVFRILSVPRSIRINLTTRVIIARACGGSGCACACVIRMRAPRVCTLVLFIILVFVELYGEIFTLWHSLYALSKFELGRPSERGENS